ncbi:Spy/CpxP family protein refolding chaperone [Xanthobacter agilis]|uniref:LTXXQ motif family protein n=1 Tax=Xanthobacter agilis TaxID=47492 RepID=A0ABU0L8J9_XANAG|nr:Spy/CpxP family protein refolding chaperone [Xanthobacter agilis]MDQ0503417.1 hypothetical protein [Xanthobacter agilis]
MKKAVIAAATAALIAGSAIAHAAGPADATPPQSAQSAAPQAAPQSAPAATAPAAPQGMPAKQAAAFEAHLAELKGGLKLTPDQEKLWPAFETALRNVANDRTARMAELRTMRQEARQSGQRPARPDMVTRVREASDRMTAMAGELRQVADTLDPLYQSFDAAQKKYFETTARKGLGGFFGMSRPPRGERPNRG